MAEEYTYQILVDKKNNKVARVQRLSPKYKGEYEIVEEAELKNVLEKYQEIYKITKPNFTLSEEVSKVYDVYIVSDHHYDETKNQLSIQG